MQPQPRTLEQASATTGISTLQLELRRLFRAVPAHVALLQSLARLGEHLRATYVSIHARLGSRFLSEEWVREGMVVGDALRETVNENMLEAMDAGKARCARLGEDPDFAVSVIAAVIYDQDLEEVGAAAIVVGPGDREGALHALSQFEGIMGFISVLASGDGGGGGGGSGVETEHLDPQAARAAMHPVRLAFHMVSRLQNRHGLEQVAVGFVQGARKRIRVVAAGGLDDVRAANPGVKLIRAAMEECFDRREIVLCPGTIVTEDSPPQDDCRMHSQWSRSVGGDAVGSFPVRFEDQIVAVVSVRHGGALETSDLAGFAEELGGYETLVPLASLSVRGVAAHVRDSTMAWARGKLLSGRRKAVALLVLPVLLVGWLAFGSLPYSLTVPCVVVALDQRTVSSPREGTLIDVRARPGVPVAAGELLAVLDAREETLKRVELEAELARVDAQIDMALGTGDAGMVRVLSAERGAIVAELEVVKLSIEQAEIRAPMTGTVIVGDLRRRVGSTVALGEPLFEMATGGRLAAELHIPENRMSQDLDGVTGVLAPSVRPHERISLGPVSVFPVSRVVDGKNVFYGESKAFEEAGGLLPGMEGFAHLDVGWRPVWWVLTHRITDWMHLRFWL